MADSDAELVEAAGRGDSTAMSELLERYAPAVTRFSIKMCGQRQDAEDVVQETLAAAVKGLPSFRGDAAISTWLFTIARSFCIKKRRTSKFAPRHVVSLDAEHPPVLAAPGDVLPDEVAMRREALHAVEIALGELPSDQREVLLLRDVEGLSAQEAAKVVGVSVGALKSRLHRARAALKSQVAPRLSPSAPPAPRPSCPEIDAIFSRYLEGDIGPEQCAQMEAHVQGCEACHASCEALRQSLSLCRASAAAEVPEEIQERVRRAIRELSAAGLPAPT